MIRYQLKCKCAHAFDSWFRSSSDFDEQKAGGLLNCPLCGSDKVEKALMAPNVATSRKKAAARSSAVPEEQQTVAAPATAEEAEMRRAMKAMKDYVTQNADYVGDKFTTVARDMHYGDAPQRGIYGEAAFNEVRELQAEGIEVMPLPSLPEEKN